MNFFFSLGIYALICFLISDSCTNLCLLVCVCVFFFSFSDGILLASKSFHLHILNVIYLLLDNLYLCNFSYHEKFMQMILFILHFCLLVKWFIWIVFLRIGLSGQLITGIGSETKLVIFMSLSYEREREREIMSYPMLISVK